MQRLSGQVEGFGTHPHLSARFTDGTTGIDRRWDATDPRAPADAESALGVVLEWLHDAATPLEVRAIGHRVVHGGTRYAAPILIDDAVLAHLATLEPLAPLHQPHNLAGMRAARAHFPGIPQVACFDTAFHRGHDFAEEAFAIPREYHEAGVLRYGFHGLSYEYIAQRLAELDPEAAAGRTIVAHLGSGASICAMRAGRSVSSSMGFTPLDGLPMGTRPGQLDPGVLLWLMTERGMDAAALSDLLYHRCGLKGLSGVSNDLRDLHASDAPGAREAIDYFVARLRREIGGLAAVLGGVDALVFTAGIGENDVALRAETLATTGWLGLAVDAAANATHGSGRDGLISPPGARIRVWVIPTNEELMIARHTAALTSTR
jgi:acetate kinase